VLGASAIHILCLDELTEDSVREIEQIHSSWIEFEVAGEDHSLMALCADDIELWPPNAQPLLGRAAVSAQMAHRTTRIHCIEITDRRIRGILGREVGVAGFKPGRGPVGNGVIRR
jgi:hypothetical protein